MKIEGDTIYLTADEVATAIDAYLTAHQVNIDGPRTISQPRSPSLLTGEWSLVTAARIYVDPSGRIFDNRE